MRIREIKGASVGGRDELGEEWISDLRRKDAFNLGNLMKSLERQNYGDAVAWMREIGLGIGSRGIRVKGVNTKAMDAHHQDLVREMLLVFRDPVEAGFSDDLDLEIMVRGAERLGLRWPELAVMRTSLDADSERSLVEMRGQGARIMADHIAGKMAAQIAAGDDIGVGYTVQELGRIDRDIAAAALEPISGSIASWFERMVHDRASPAFALGELSRLERHTGVLYPGVRAALDGAREGIIRHILELIRDNNDREAEESVRDLQRMGVDWPQLRVIAGSLLEGNGRIKYHKSWWHQLEEQKLFGELHHDLTTKGNWEMIALDLLELGDLGVRLEKPRSVLAAIADNRQAVIRSILNDIRLKPDSDRMLVATGVLAELGFGWPEIGMIRQSLDDEGNKT